MVASPVARKASAVTAPPDSRCLGGLSRPRAACRPPWLPVVAATHRYQRPSTPARPSARLLAASAAAPPQPRRGVHVWVATVARQSEPASERLHAAARALTATHAPLRHVPGDAVVSIAPAYQAPVQHGLVAPAEHTSADRRERGHWSFHPVGRRVQFIYDYLRRHAVSAAAQDAGATGLVPAPQKRFQRRPAWTDTCPFRHSLVRAVRPLGIA